MLLGLGLEIKLNLQSNTSIEHVRPADCAPLQSVAGGLKLRRPGRALVMGGASRSVMGGDARRAGVAVASGDGGGIGGGGSCFDVVSGSPSSGLAIVARRDCALVIDCPSSSVTIKAGSLANGRGGVLERTCSTDAGDDASQLVVGATTDTLGEVEVLAKTSGEAAPNVTCTPPKSRKNDERSSGSSS